MSHPNYDTIVNFIENRLSAADREAVEKHLVQSCPRCDAKIMRLRSVFALTSTDKTVAPPADVLNRAISLYKKPPEISSGSVLRVFAQLQFDSRRQLSALPTRGFARSRQLLFTADQLDIDLQITPDNGEYNLIGQVLGSVEITAIASAFVWLQQKSGPLIRGTETDALGQFTFRQVPSGIYDLVFELGNRDITITSLEFNNDQG